jgi:kinesin family protein C1
LGWEYSLEASFLEIYNETIRDLLAPDHQASLNAPSFEIKHGPGGKTTVTDLSVVPVCDRETIMELLQKASKARAVGETLCNQRSSRSHSVFILSINGHNKHTGESCQGVLNLVDLAGSERLSQSGATGDRLRETQAINSSLSSLGDVISAIARGDAHVPYRNSKLTWLLQGALGGTPPGKTLMFVNVAPEQGCVPESLCSLRFAAKVNTCQIGQAKRSVR